MQILVQIKRQKLTKIEPLPPSNLMEFSEIKKQKKVCFWSIAKKNDICKIYITDEWGM